MEQRVQEQTPEALPFTRRLLGFVVLSFGVVSLFLETTQPTMPFFQKLFTTNITVVVIQHWATLLWICLSGFAKVSMILGSRSSNPAKIALAFYLVPSLISFFFIQEGYSSLQVPGILTALDYVFMVSFASWPVIDLFDWMLMNQIKNEE